MIGMSNSKLVAGLGDVDELWGAALKESGLRYQSYRNGKEAVESAADFILLDLRGADKTADLQTIHSTGKAPVISLVDRDIDRKKMMKLKEEGVSGYLLGETPPAEVVLRIRSMMRPDAEKRTGESRSSRRVWLQQKVKFRVFDKDNEAWSTTLSETGIFLRTSLSFPLYSVLQLEFFLLGDSEPFRCDGVIVRQEVESEMKGLGVMFQNLNGENIRRLEAFFDLIR